MTQTGLEELKASLAPELYSDDPVAIAPHLEEWRSKYQGRSSLLLLPRTTADVSQMLMICNKTRTAVVPQGGNTGLVGAQIPFQDEVILNLGRMNKMRALDEVGHTIIVEAGMILADLQRLAQGHGLMFPLSLAAEGSATIGGNLATNAGGVNVLRYGMARDLALGLEVVLADGTVLDLLRTLRKDNTGYDLKQLFIGAEGTLGVITAAALKLFAQPAERVTAFIATRSPGAAVALLSELQARTGGLLCAFELIPRIGLQFVMRHIEGMRDPLEAASPWYVLAEATSGAGTGLKDLFEQSLASAIDEGLASDAVLAESEAQREQIWSLRETMSEAQKREGASIKHDIAVPISAIPNFLTRATAAVQRLIPGARPVSFGHLGDGNIHFNFQAPQPGEDLAFLARWEEVQTLVHDIVHEFGGSISAEHGIGVLKRDQLTRYKSAAELATMRALKRSLDPNNILNPGKVVML